MESVSDIFKKGPQAVRDYFAHQASSRFVDDMFLKELADISWTRATTLSKSDKRAAQKWAAAALDGYEILSSQGTPSVAETAAENAAALRSWKLLAASFT